MVGAQRLAQEQSGNTLRHKPEANLPGGLYGFRQQPDIHVNARKRGDNECCKRSAFQLWHEQLVN